MANRSSLLALMLALGGCETASNYTDSRLDERIVVGPGEVIRIPERNMRRYMCLNQGTLVCDGNNPWSVRCRCD